MTSPGTIYLGIRWRIDEEQWHNVVYNNGFGPTSDEPDCADAKIGSAGEDVTLTGNITINSGCTGTVITNVEINATATINAAESWTCTGTGTMSAINRQAQNVSGASCAGGTCTICTP